MTKQQKKTVLICIAVIIGSFVIRNIVISAIQMAHYRQAVIAAQQRKAQQRPLQPTAKADAQPAHSAPAAQAFPYPGIWAGSGAVEGKGLCDLRVEMRPAQDLHFTGDWSMTCRGYSPLVSQDRSKRGAEMFNRLTPEAAMFNGTMKDGVLQFELDKVLAPDSEGCAPASLTITPFGSAQLASQWQEGGNCPGGHLMLHKVRP